MRGSKTVPEKVYPAYRPYPVTWGSDSPDYPAATEEGTRGLGSAHVEADARGPFLDLIGDPPARDWFPLEALPSNDGSAFCPLRLVRALFVDRLDFFWRSLDELGAAKQEREHLCQYALEELDPEIRKCEQALSVLKGPLNDFDRRGAHWTRRRECAQRPRHVAESDQEGPRCPRLLGEVSGLACTEREPPDSHRS